MFIACVTLSNVIPELKYTNINYGTPFGKAELSINSFPWGGASAIWKIYLRLGTFRVLLQLISFAAAYNPSKTASG